MDHPSTPEKMYAWLLSDPDNPRLIGEIVRQSNGDVGLQYDAAWLQNGFALSEDMPLEDLLFTPIHRVLRQSGAPGALDDARPDRWGEKVIRYLYKRGASVYDYLYFAGDERFGAIGVSNSKESYSPFMCCPLPRLEDADDLNEAIQIIESGEGTLKDQQRALVGAGGSLGGAKPKAVIAINGSEWVLKFSNGEPFDQPLVEHASMTLAHKAGIHVAPTLLVRLKTEHAIAIKRFDRESGGRVHCLSACTLLRSEVPATVDPEFGYPQLARALRKYADIQTLDAQLHELFRRMIFNILIANTDDHEKNHSLLCRVDRRTMRLELSQGYDIVPTGSGALEHQFLISNTSREPSLKKAMAVANDFNLSAPKAAQAVMKIIEVVNGWQEHFRDLGVTENDMSEVASLIDAQDLLRQRQAFSVADYIHEKPRKKSVSGAKTFR